jgi:hypothetical protein
MNLNLEVVLAIETEELDCYFLREKLLLTLSRFCFYEAVQGAISG